MEQPKTIFEAKKEELKQAEKDCEILVGNKAFQLNENLPAPEPKKDFKQKAKHKNKKTKQKEQLPEIKIGATIRDLKIDLSTNLFILGLLLIVFNCVFIISAFMLAYWINLWWVWLIDITLVIYCVTHSVCSYFYNKKNYHFTLHTNCLVLNSMWYYNTVIDYKLIKEIKVKTGFWDRIFGRGTCTLTIYLKNEMQAKINLYFLKENPTQLYNELWAIINENNFN